MLLGPGTLDEMIAEKETAEIACEFCGCKYELSVDALQKLRNSLDETQVH
jgi:redox-regulated HSP33 family molecular chaperone